MYNDFMDELEFAAECGFDAVCVNEHHSNGYGLMPSPNLVDSSLARRTTDTALCILGNSLALYNPPTRVAEEFAMIDCISGGRLIAGFPVGSPMDTCFAYGQNPSLLRERYHEAHDLFIRPWTALDTFAWNGRFNQTDGGQRRCGAASERRRPRSTRSRRRRTDRGRARCDEVTMPGSRNCRWCPDREIRRVVS
jgi:alkanesulfonate monooxygenase SsuD/methylene tetrahydromethanopterin reductase-like flavin-dependent oxidoreductase (luciferase family)